MEEGHRFRRDQIGALVRRLRGFAASKGVVSKPHLLRNRGCGNRAARKLRRAPGSCQRCARCAVVEQPIWTVPEIGALPDDANGRLMRRGRDLVTATYAHIGPEVSDPAKRYAGNNLACTNCHLLAGTKKFGLALFGLYGDFPKYSTRTAAEITIEDRLNSCMTRSMNGRPIPNDAPEMQALVAYIKFLSTGVPAGQKVPGLGTGTMPELDRAADPVRGQAVYAQNCSVCHAPDGLGVRRSLPTTDLGYMIPPLWGPDSFNDGAGMSRLITAANFIHFNMPHGTDYLNPQLTPEQAWDVAAYMVSRPRPHKAGLDKDFPDLLDKPVDVPYGPYADGFSEQQHKYGPFAPIRAAIARLKAEGARAARRRAKGSPLSGRPRESGEPVAASIAKELDSRLRGNDQSAARAKRSEIAQRRLLSIWSQTIAATSGPPRFLIARIPVGEVTLISVRKPSITSMPTKISPRSRSAGPIVWQISRSRGVRSVSFGVPPRTMLERRSSGAGTRLTAPANSPSTRMMRLSPCFTAGRNCCTTHCSRNVDGEQVVERAEVEILAGQPEHRLAALAVERLHHDVAVLDAERLDLGEVAGDQRRRHQVGKFHHEHLLRRVADLARVVDHQRLRMDALEQMRGGDVGEVERRVLAQQDDVEFAEVDAARLAEGEMIADLVAHLQVLHGREHPRGAQRQPVRRVVDDRVAALLRLQQQREGRIAADVDPLDRVHLYGDFQAHRPP